MAQRSIDGAWRRMRQATAAKKTAGAAAAATAAALLAWLMARRQRGAKARWRLGASMCWRHAQPAIAESIWQRKTNNSQYSMAWR